jgi:hypothetical protein
VDQVGKEKKDDEEMANLADQGPGHAHFNESSSTISCEPGSLLSLSDRLSLNSQASSRRASFIKSTNTLVNRFGSIFEMEEKEDGKEEDRDNIDDENKPINHLALCCLEDELTSAQSTCSLFDSTQTSREVVNLSKLFIDTYSGDLALTSMKQS